MTWEVYLNGRSLGIVETNLAWAEPYWRGRCSKEKRYTLRTQHA
jgi:hypothetical protein